MHDHNIHSLATINKFTSPRQNSLPLSSHQYPEKFKDFFACRIVLAANHQYPGNFQRLSGQQAVFQQEPAIIQQSAAATSNSNQQQQPASSNQQQQPAKAINSSNQQPAAATSSSNHRHQPATATRIHPSTSIHAATNNRPEDICTTNANLR